MREEQLGCTRKKDGEHRTFTQLTLHCYPTVHSLHDMFNDGESQAGASHLAGTRLVNSIKTLEKAGQISRGNSDTVISDRDAHLIVLGSRDLHSHFAIRAVELHGIVQEIHQRLLEVDPLTEDRNFLNTGHE